MPACGPCNANKGDRIPAPDFLVRRRNPILTSWELQRGILPKAFEQQIRYDLIGFNEPLFAPETALERLSHRCRFLIQERGYDSWTRK
jgi:hypothetical protein